MTTVAVNTYTHSVTYLADNMLKSVKDVIRLVGLDPTNFVDDWSLNMRAIKTWLGTGLPEDGPSSRSTIRRPGPWWDAGISTWSTAGARPGTAPSGPTPTT